MIKYVKILKIIGVLFILMGLILNPIFVVKYIKKNISDAGLKPARIMDIILYDMVMIILGLLLIELKPIYLFILRHSLVKKVFLSLISIMFAIMILEFTFFIAEIVKSKHEENMISGNQYRYLWIYEKHLGYKGKPNIKVNAIKLFKNGTMIYNVTYNLDEFGRRKSCKNNGTAIILFGDSFVFGEGIEDNETLASFLCEYNFSVYNYGLPGYGPQHMLANLERDDFYQEIESTNVIVIYIFTTNQIRRAIGDMTVYNNWGSDMPYYILVNDSIVRENSFTTGRLFLSVFYRILGKSQISKFFNINLPPKRYEHFYLTYKIIDKSEILIRSNLHAKFYVLIHPLESEDEDSLKMTNLLITHNISVLYYPSFFSANYSIPHDDHPNAKANYLLAEYITKTLLHKDYKQSFNGNINE